MKKHTIQDGTIPLSGLSPLVVCRQWGTGDLNRVVSQTINLPLSINSILFAAAADIGSGAFSMGVQVEDRTLKIYQNADQNPGGALSLIGYRYIAICQG